MEPPVLIPHTEVKRGSADDTHTVGKVGSRQNKGVNTKSPRSKAARAFCMPSNPLY